MKFFLFLLLALFQQTTLLAVKNEDLELDSILNDALNDYEKFSQLTTVKSDIDYNKTIQDIDEGINQFLKTSFKPVPVIKEEDSFYSTFLNLGCQFSQNVSSYCLHFKDHYLPHLVEKKQDLQSLCESFGERFTKENVKNISTSGAKLVGKTLFLLSLKYLNDPKMFEIKKELWNIFGGTYAASGMVSLAFEAFHKDLVSFLPTHLVESEAEKKKRYYEREIDSIIKNPQIHSSIKQMVQLLFQKYQNGYNDDQKLKIEQHLKTAILLSQQVETKKLGQDNFDTDAKNKLNDIIKGLPEVSQNNFKKFIKEIMAYSNLGEDTRTRVNPVFFLGPPGTGKTFTAITLAKALGLPLVNIKIGGASSQKFFGYQHSDDDMLGTFISDIANTSIEVINPQTNIKEKKQYRNIIIFLDEVDRMFKTQSYETASFTDWFLKILEIGTQTHTIPGLSIDIPINRWIIIMAGNEFIKDKEGAFASRLRTITFPDISLEKKTKIAKEILKDTAVELKVKIDEKDLKFVEEMAQYDPLPGMRKLNMLIRDFAVSKTHSIIDDDNDSSTFDYKSFYEEDFKKIQAKMGWRKINDKDLIDGNWEGSGEGNSDIDFQLDIKKGNYIFFLKHKDQLGQLNIMDIGTINLNNENPFISIVKNWNDENEKRTSFENLAISSDGQKIKFLNDDEETILTKTTTDHRNNYSINKIYLIDRLKEEDSTQISEPELNQIKETIPFFYNSYNINDLEIRPMVEVLH